MRALRTFTVRPRLPEPLAPLQRLAMNLRWSWDERTRDVFRWVDPEQWDATRHDPVRLLSVVDRERLDALSRDPAFLRFLGEVDAELARYLERPRWFQGRMSSLRQVAYFSPEFGISAALPQYSGGLGVLAGDHLKAASDLGVPLAGVGLLYRQGYFRQHLGGDGWQQERYPSLDPHAMAVSVVDGATVEVDLAGSPLRARVWSTQVGRVPLYLLDADIDDNDPEGRSVTDRLYGGGTEHRLRQEILLGIGGVRALRAAGVESQVFHTNEGHAGFLGLERIRTLVVDEHLTFGEAVEAVRGSTIFTTHTPVPAGIDRFPRDLMEKYFGRWAEECRVGFDDLMALGHFPGEPADAPFNMAVMGLRLAGLSNGVAALHGRTSRAMFAPVWPGVPVDDVPITSVTNGVHAYTWVSSDMDDLYRRHIIPGWAEAGDTDWARIDDARDDDLWRVRDQGREALVTLVRSRLRASLLARGAGEADVGWCEEAFDPGALTIGFARRFAAYKRATLVLSQPDRLRGLLLDPNRPVQIVFAGKAHPADDYGKEIIREIVQFSSDPGVRHRIAFIEDYDIDVARVLYQGCDVWLNTPRRPQEACGTSGEKAALNGALNCSILDGWWDEMFDGQNGWAIASAEGEADLGRRDAAEAASLYQILERHVVPLFYDRPEGRVPRRWVRRMKASIRSLGPRVGAARMVRDYVERLYEPVAEHADAVRADGYGRARALAAWKARVASAWGHVAVVSVESDEDAADLGSVRVVEAIVSLGALEPGDVSVELVHGPVGPNDEISTADATVMTPERAADDTNLYRYSGKVHCDRAGRYGFTVRLVPSHPDLLTPTELGLVAWA